MAAHCWCRCKTKIAIQLAVPNVPAARAAAAGRSRARGKQHRVARGGGLDMRAAVRGCPERRLQETGKASRVCGCAHGACVWCCVACDACVRACVRACMRTCMRASMFFPPPICPNTQQQRHIGRRAHRGGAGAQQQAACRLPARDARPAHAQVCGPPPAGRGV